MPDQADTNPAPNAREIAEQVIRCHARDGRRGTIAVAVSQLGLPREDFEATCAEVADLIPHAVVTVTWPGEPTIPQLRDALHVAHCALKDADQYCPGCSEHGPGHADLCEGCMQATSVREALAAIKALGEADDA